MRLHLLDGTFELFRISSVGDSVLIMPREIPGDKAVATTSILIGPKWHQPRSSCGSMVAACLDNVKRVRD